MGVTFCSHACAFVRYYCPKYRQRWSFWNVPVTSYALFSIGVAVPIYACRRDRRISMAACWPLWPVEAHHLYYIYLKHILVQVHSSGRLSRSFINTFLLDHQNSAWCRQYTNQSRKRCLPFQFVMRNIASLVFYLKTLFIHHRFIPFNSAPKINNGDQCASTNTPEKCRCNYKIRRNHLYTHSCQLILIISVKEYKHR